MMGLFNPEAGDRPSDHQLLDLLGALEDVVDLRVAVHALHRVLTGVAVATQDLHRTAVRPAFSFDWLPSALMYSPLRDSQAARHTSSREASISVIMSASMKAIDWFSMIALPNALRSCAYCSA